MLEMLKEKWNSQKKLELLLEKYIKESYNKKDYLRCKHLVNRLLDINENNRVWLYYDIKLTPDLLKKAKYRRLWFKTLKNILLDIRFFILMIWVWLWFIK